MTKFLLVFTLAVGLLPLTAQVTLTNDYFPVAGDTLRSNTADSLSRLAVDVGSAGANQGWNFGFPTVINERSEAVTSAVGNEQFPEATIKIQTTPVTESFYTVSTTEFNLVGINSSLALLPSFAINTAVTPPRAVRRAPLNYQDSFESTTANSVTISPDSIPEEALELIGTALNGVDSLRITTESTRSSVIDAYGNARLRDNFYNVLREVQTESVFIRLETKFGNFPFIDVTNTIVVLSPQLAAFIGQQDVTTTYLFWNPDSKEPIAEVATLEATGEVTNFSFKRALTATSTGDVNFSRAELKAYPNPATDWLTFQMSGLDQGRYTLNVLNTLGSVVETRNFSPLGNQTSLSMDVSHLPSGLYFYSLRNERGRVVGTRKLRVK